MVGAVFILFLGCTTQGPILGIDPSSEQSLDLGIDQQGDAVSGTSLDSGQPSEVSFSDRFIPDVAFEDGQVILDSEMDSSVCDQGEQRQVPCGLNERGLQLQRCSENAWQQEAACEDPDRCVDGEVDVMPCPEMPAASQSRSCVEGQWMMWSTCTETVRPLRANALRSRLRRRFE